MKCKSDKNKFSDISKQCDHDFSTNEECNFCGAVFVDQNTIKDGCSQDASYVCNTCGRTAIKAEYLCNPNELG